MKVDLPPGHLGKFRRDRERCESCRDSRFELYQDNHVAMAAAVGAVFREEASDGSPATDSFGMIEVNAMASRDEEIAEYHEQGYLVVRNVLSAVQARDLTRAVQKQAAREPWPTYNTYPLPAKYTIAGNRMADDPSLAAIAEHPVIVEAVERILGQRAFLSAFVAYLRTPGSSGSGPHCDYKRWRPVGSSMDWLFAIVPLTDFDSSYGPLLVAPGSHRLSRVVQDRTCIRDVRPPDATDLAAFVDPQLQAGDLLLMNMFTWHEAPAGSSRRDRCGIFNKYCAVNAPPAAGWYPYSPAARHVLSDAGQRLIPYCFDGPITSSRLLIERPGSESTFLLRHDADRGRWQLPGDAARDEEEEIGWDVGSRIGALQGLVRSQLQIDVSWMSYIADREDEPGVCRVYGYLDEDRSLEAALDASGCEWFTRERLQRLPGSEDIRAAIDAWQRTDVVRGKGKAWSQKSQQFDERPGVSRID